jgi:hypothetical protein
MPLFVLVYIFGNHIYDIYKNALGLDKIGMALTTGIQ